MYGGVERVHGRMFRILGEWTPWNCREGGSFAGDCLILSSMSGAVAAVSGRAPICPTGVGTADGADVPLRAIATRPAVLSADFGASPGQRAAVEDGSSGEEDDACGSSRQTCTIFGYRRRFSHDKHNAATCEANSRKCTTSLSVLINFRTAVCQCAKAMKSKCPKMKVYVLLMNCARVLGHTAVARAPVVCILPRSRRDMY